MIPFTFEQRGPTRFVWSEPGAYVAVEFAGDLKVTPEIEREVELALLDALERHWLDADAG